ncbi:MAG: hypothetical protein U0X20_27490 [Caldilineaceae bacterium]
MKTPKKLRPQTADDAISGIEAAMLARRIVAAQQLAAGQLPTTGALNDNIAVDWETEHVNHN